MTYPLNGHWAARSLTAVDDTDVLTVDELLERARIVAGDAESPELLASYIAAARQQVEQDTGCALPTQTIAVRFDAVDGAMPLTLPWPPLQVVDSITYTDADGLDVVLDPDDLIAHVDLLSMPARVWWIPGVLSGLPSPIALTLSLTVGWTQATLPPALKFAVGLLASHYLTAGRDRTVIGTSVLVMPAGYEDAIAPWRLVKVI
jgi:uncharacterized phiE125 gp8 family phage protein